MVINPIVGVYIPIIRIPIKGGMTIPNIATFDHGTHVGMNIPACMDLIGFVYHLSHEKRAPGCLGFCWGLYCPGIWGLFH